MAGKSNQWHNKQGSYPASEHEPSPYKPGRPAKYAGGGLVEGVRQRAGYAMGGDAGSKKVVEQVGRTFRTKK